jgi:hypothetical protein
MLTAIEFSAVFSIAEWSVRHSVMMEADVASETLDIHHILT